MQVPSISYRRVIESCVHVPLLVFVNEVMTTTKSTITLTLPESVTCTGLDSTGISKSLLRRRAQPQSMPWFIATVPVSTPYSHRAEPFSSPGTGEPRTLTTVYDSMPAWMAALLCMRGSV